MQECACRRATHLVAHVDVELVPVQRTVLISGVKRRLGLLSALLATAVWAHSETQLPDQDDYESIEVEPPILVPNRPMPAEKLSQTQHPGRDPAELEKQLVRVKRVAADAQLLFKRGVLSKMEVELRELRIVRVQAELENARLEHAKAELDRQQARHQRGEITKDEVAVAEREVQTARAAADQAEGARQRAEIGVAEANVRRQRKLAELGSARASDVVRAERKLADLKAGTY